MINGKFLLFLVLLFQFNKAETTKLYSLKIKDALTDSDKIILNKGIFTKISLVLSTETEDDFTYSKEEKQKLSYKITFNDENIMTMKKEMILTPEENLVYTNYIGISCSSEIKDSYSFSIKVESANDYTDEASLIYDSKINVDITQIKTEIKLDLLFNAIAQQSKNFFQIENELYNVDEIKVSINDAYSLLSEFELNSLSILSFVDREEEISKDSPGNHGILFNFPFFPKGRTSAAKLKFKLNLDADLSGVCFQLKKSDFEFELKDDNVTSLDANVKTAIVYNTENETPKYDISSKIKIHTIIPSAPVIIECRFETNSTFLFDDKNLLKSTEKTNIFKTVVTSTGNFDINMENLNASAEYYVKCDISNTGIGKLIDEIEVTIGNFNGSDVIRHLMPSKDPNATPQCAKFTFDDSNQAFLFKAFGPIFCTYFMKKNDSLISRALPSIICDITSQKEKSTTLCVAPSPFHNAAKYISQKESLFNKRFDEFVIEMLNFNTSRYNILNLNVKKVEREYDIPINPSSISVSYDKKSANLPTYDFKVKSTHSQQIQCYYNAILSSENSKFLKLIGNSVTLLPGEEKIIQIGGSPFFPKIMYTENFRCYNLPDFIYRYETTGTMTKFTYYTETFSVYPDLIGDTTDDTTINCNKKENLINPRCLKENIISIINQMKTEIPKTIKEIEEKVEQYAAAAMEIKEKFLQELLENFQTLIKDTQKITKEVIEKAIEILEYLSFTDCSIYASGSTNIIEQTIKGELYIKCRIKKQDILEEILNLIKNNLQCPALIPLISSNVLDNDLEENIKYILLFINELSKNPESYKNKTSEVIIELVECIVDNFDKYWPIVENYLKNTKNYLDQSIKAIKRDIENIILQALENLAKVIDFDQLDGYIAKAKDEIKKTGIIIYEKGKKIQKKILEFSKRLIEFGVANYTFSGSMIANIETKDGISISADSETKATFVEDKDIVILTNSNFLLNKEGVYALQTLVFQSPIISINATGEVEGTSDTVSTFISITLYDSKGKEITIEDIEEKFKPTILYLKEKYDHLKACYSYDEKDNELYSDGITAVKEFSFMGKEYFKCASSHLSSFTAGTFDNYKTEEKKKKSKAGVVVAVIIVILILLVAAYFGYVFYKKRKAKLADAKEFGASEGLVSM